MSVSKCRCEVRPGPEFLIRKYSFQKRNFTVEQFYYKDSQCTTPLYAIVAKGRIKAQRWSLLIQGGAEAKYHLYSAKVFPYSSDAAWGLRRRALLTCPHLSKIHWKPFRQYAIMRLVGDTIQDCTDRFSWTMNEFQLLKLEKRMVYQGYRATISEELYTGDIHLDNTVRKHFYRPTDYQPALRKSTDSTCKICQQIGAADFHHPPVLPMGHHSPVMILGDWISIRCETRPLGMFITRRLTFHSDGNHWSGTYRYYRDPHCRQPSFTLEAEGKYSEILTSSLVIGGAAHYKFSVRRLKITPEHYSISENLNFYNGTGCGVPGSWQIGITQDVTATHGCKPMDIKLPNVVPETIKTIVESKKMFLYMGKRVLYGGPRSHSYPTSFQPPLQNCIKRPQTARSTSSSSFFSSSFSSSSSYFSPLTSSVGRRYRGMSEAKPIVQLADYDSLHLSSLAIKNKVNHILFTTILTVTIATIRGHSLFNILFMLHFCVCLNGLLTQSV